MVVERGLQQAVGEVGQAEGERVDGGVGFGVAADGEVGGCSGGLARLDGGQGEGGWEEGGGQEEGFAERRHRGFR